MRPFLLVSFMLLSVTVSASTQISPVAPVYQALTSDELNPAAASNGAHTLVAWAVANSVYAESWSVCTRILGVENEGQCVSGVHASVASDGNDFLVVRAIGASRFNTYAYDNVIAEVIRDSGRHGASRTLNNSLYGSVTSVMWDGRQWLVAILSDGVARIEFLDHDLAQTREPLVLGASRNVRMFERGGVWWAVRWLDSGSEIVTFDESTRFTLEGDVTIAGTIAFINDGGRLDAARFDPHGIDNLHPLLADTYLVDAQPFENGARAIVQSNGAVRAIVVDGAGAIVQDVEVYTDSLSASAMLLGDTLYFSARLREETASDRDIYVRSLALSPIDGELATLISTFDVLVQSDPVIASNGTRSVVFWTERNYATGMAAVYRRDLDANGLPTGEVTALPNAANTLDADVALSGNEAVLVWSEGGVVYADIHGEKVPLGNGNWPAVATNAQGAFVTWWGSSDHQVYGTPLEGRVPGGFRILPAFDFQYPPAITALDDGFLVLWTASNEMQSVVISPTGAVRSSTDIGKGTITQRPILSSRLAAWPGTLFTYAPAGQPFQRFDPHWGANWAPLAIVTLTADTSRVFLARGQNVYASDVTMAGAFITNTTPLDFLGQFESLRENNVAVINGKSVVVTRVGKRVEITPPGSAKARPARRAR